jgi:hypothetical protein
VKEQSHKEEMSAALRGDFQRLRERGVPATLVPHGEAVDAPEPVVAEVTAPADVRAEPDPVVDDPPAEAATTAGSEPVRAAEADSAETDAEAPAAPEPEHAVSPPRRGWLSRLAGR